MSFFKERMGEPTTYLGLGAIIAAIAPVLRWDEGEQIGQVVESVAVPASNGDWLTTASLLISGVLGIFMAEKAKN